MFFPSITKRKAKYQKQWNDVEVIPDKHNCGCHGTLTPWYETWSGATAETDGMFRVLNTHPRVNENLDFSHVYLYWGKTYNDEDWYFKNCNFYGVRADGTTRNLAAVQIIASVENPFTIYLENCTISGFVACAIYNMGKVNVHMKNCIIDCPKQDGAKGSDGTKTIIENCYFYGGGGYGWIEGEDIHSDAIQWSSGSRAFIENVRCEWISFNTDSLKTLANACLYVDHEQGSVLTMQECTMRNCLAIGGGYTMYLVTGDDADYRIKGVNLLNVRYGCNYTFGARRVMSETVTIETDDYKAQDKTFVSSVWKDNGTTHFYASNYTNEARTIIAVYGVNGVEEQATFTIAKCPTKTEQNEDKVTYADWSSLPFDVEYVINADVDYIVIYDTSVAEENQIRFADMF